MSLKLGVTVGDGCNSLDDFLLCIDHGVTLVRFNLANKLVEKKIDSLVENLKKAEKERNINLTHLYDIPFPKAKYRYRTYLKKRYELTKGDVVQLTSEPGLLNSSNTLLVEREFLDYIAEESRLIVGDGELVLKLLDKNAESFRFRAENDWFVSDSKAFTIEGQANLKNSPLNEFHLEKIRTHRPDNVALSFVESYDDIHRFKVKSQYKGGVVAKIETLKGVRNAAGIGAHADGIIVGRGDLALCAGLENLGWCQESVLQQCLREETCVYVATEVFASLASRPVPLRAELSDFFNLVKKIRYGGVILTKESSMEGSLATSLALISKLLSK